MKTLTLILPVTLVLATATHADDLADKLRRAFDKAKVEVKDMAQQAGRKGREWYNAAKENLRLSRPEYTTRAEKKLTQLTSDIGVLKELATNQKDYFKTRVQALEQHAAYAQTELDNMKAAESDAAFKARQALFNKTLWTLEAATEQAQEEAGL